MNLFEALVILNIQVNAEQQQDGRVSRNEIEKAYRKRALMLHPDRRGGNATLFRQLQAAKEVALQHFGTTSSIETKYVPTNHTAVVETLYKDRTCVRQVVHCSSSAKDNFEFIAVATDDGVWFLRKSLASSSSEWTCETYERTNSFFCCAVVGNMVYAGGTRGRIFWLHTSTLEHGMITTATPHDEESNIVSITVTMDNTWIAFCTSTQDVAMLMNLSAPNQPPQFVKTWHQRPESTCAESILLESSRSTTTTDDEEVHLYLWIGGSPPASQRGER